MSNSLKDQLLGLGFKPVPKPERKPEASVRPSPKAVQPKTTDRTTVIAITSDAYAWVPGDADWDVGVPEIRPVVVLMPKPGGSVGLPAKA